MHTCRNEPLSVRLTHSELEGVQRGPPPPPPGAEECVSSHRVHRLLVTFPYVSEVGTLITSACDSRRDRGGEEGRRWIKGAGRGRGGGGSACRYACLILRWED